MTDCFYFFGSIIWKYVYVGLLQHQIAVTIYSLKNCRITIGKNRKAGNVDAYCQTYKT